MNKFLILAITFFITVPLTFAGFMTANNKTIRLQAELEDSASDSARLNEEIIVLKNEDLRKTNDGVKKEISDLKTSYKNALEVYRQLLELREDSSLTQKFDSAFASILDSLSKDKLVESIERSNKLSDDIKKEEARLATLIKIPANVVEKNTPPTSGYSKQKVVVGDNSYLVDIIAADLNSTKVVVDTASDSTCTNDCPVMSLADYVSRSGAFAGINGTYFCPDTYPDCASKKNTFDVLVMNKNKVYFNSDNNVYSSVPVAVFSGNSARFISESKDWGRDAGVDAVIANRPLLVLDGKARFSGTGEPKEGTKGNRSFLGSSDQTAYIGIVRGATVAEAATVLEAMGVKNAINLDSGGSSALWSGGYKAGPGRNLPNVVLFVKK